MPLPNSDARSSITEVASSPDETSPLAPPSRLADLEHPWLGLESFREETRAYFFGRGAEIGEIHLRLRSYPLLVLYGRSGLGKTSILDAGLVPRLREEGQRPALVRLDYKKEDYGPCNQLFLALFETEQGGPVVRFLKKKERIVSWETDVNAALAFPLPREDSASQLLRPFQLPQDALSRLWLRLHWRKESPNITHLILDQFEEVFTLGTLRAGTEEGVRDALAVILQGAVPERISRLIADHDVFLDYFDPDSMPVRVILALRDDYVYALNRWKRHLPALGQNNFELRALRGPAAFEAVFRPGELRCNYRGDVGEANKANTGLPPIISEGVAQRIVRFVAKKGEEASLEEIEAVPPILSLLCRELNERRFNEPFGTPEQPAKEVIFNEADTDVETIISTFYERCVAGQPQAVRVFIEDKLIGISGARLLQDEKSILRVFEKGCEIPGTTDDSCAEGFGDARKARECLEGLVKQRLLTPLGGGDNPNYELIHDLLASAVERSRTARQERSQTEEAQRRAEAERKAKDKAEEETRLARRRARIVFVALIFAILAAIFGFVEWYWTKKATAEANAAKQKAVAAKQDADGLIKFMQYTASPILGDVGRADIVGAINEQIMDYQRKHPPEPGNLAARREEASAIIQKGNLLLFTGQLDDALNQYRTALRIFQELLGRVPLEPDYQSNLSFSYRKVGLVQRILGDLESALKSYSQSLATCKGLAEQDPDDYDFQSALADSYKNIGSVLRDQGDLPGALKNYLESFKISEKLAKAEPNNRKFQSALADSYGNVGSVLGAQGDLSGALENYLEGFKINEKLATEERNNIFWQAAFSGSYNNIGFVLSAHGDLPRALENYVESFKISEKLAKEAPNNMLLQSALANSYRNVGSVLSDQGDLPGALKNYLESLKINEKLAKEAPNNMLLQSALADSYKNIGSVLRDQGDLPRAFKNYNDSLVIRQKLTERDPSNGWWRSNLSSNFDKIGDVLRDEGNLPTALKNYRDALAIREELSKHDPTNTSWQADLAYSDFHVGITLPKVTPAAGQQAQAIVEKGRDILRDLKKRNALTAEQQKWLAEIEAELGKAKKRDSG